MAKVIIVANFRVWIPQPGGRATPVNYTKGMVMDGLPEEVADDWAAKGLANKLPDTPKKGEGKEAKAS